MVRDLRFLVYLICGLSGTRPVAATAQTPDDLKRATAEIAALEAARLRGDSGAWQLVAPAFVFGHSTGHVDDRAAFLSWRAAASPQARSPRMVDAEPPIVKIDGNLLVRSRLLTDSAPAGVRTGASRVLDVYVRRRGQWHWLAHQTAEVRARWMPVPLDSADIAEFAGEYAAGPQQKRTFVQRGTHLVQIGRAGERRMIPLSDSSFGYDGLNATITFVRDRAGRVVAADESAQTAFTRFHRTAAAR